jgi:hypothetical protein
MLEMTIVATADLKTSPCSFTHDQANIWCNLLGTLIEAIDSSSPEQSAPLIMSFKASSSAQIFDDSVFGAPLPLTRQ